MQEVKNLFIEKRKTEKKVLKVTYKNQGNSYIVNKKEFDVWREV